MQHRCYNFVLVLLSELVLAFSYNLVVEFTILWPISKSYKICGDLSYSKTGIRFLLFVDLLHLMTIKRAILWVYKFSIV